MCLVCDRLIIGTEIIHALKKDRIEMHQHRLSVKAYEDHYGKKLNPILVQQYSVNDFPGLLLSPRSSQLDENTFECCSECYHSLSTRNKNMTSPPKHAIANDFVIGHLPSELMINGEDKPRRSGLDDKDISDIMSAAISRQRPYGFVFAFMGGAHQSIMGQYSFFEVDQTFTGSVINHYRSTGANDHLLCAMVGRFTPKQKELIRERHSKLDTKLYIDLITWYVKMSGHYAFSDVTPPEDCPQPKLLDNDNENNTDDSQDEEIEKEFGGGTHTFTSSNDPTENTSVFKSTTDFTLAIINQSEPMLIGYGGNYVPGRELKLECVFPLQFPFGIGGPKMKRRNNISELECLKHYMRLSLKQFMRGDFILVIIHMYNRIMSYRSGIITCRSKMIGDQSFAEAISTLNEDQIKLAMEKKSKNIDDNSLAGTFLSKVQTSCKTIGYSSAAAQSNKRLLYGMCDRLGWPHLFVTVTPDDENNFRVQLWANAGTELSLPSIDSSENECIQDYVIRRDTRIRYPGACALEYESIVQVLLRDLFGWDSQTKSGTTGIFGELIAWAVGHEEQGKVQCYMLYI